MSDFINGFFTNFQTLLKWVLDGTLYCMKLVPYLIFDGFLIVVETMIAAINVPSILFTYTASWSGVPPQLIYVVNAVGLPLIVALFLAAVGVRVALNLIPSWITRL